MKRIENIVRRMNIIIIYDKRKYLKKQKEQLCVVV